VFPAERIRGRKEGELVRDLPQLAAELVVFFIVVALLDPVAVDHFVLAVGLV
jgi:hypothetical protein